MISPMMMSDMQCAYIMGRKSGYLGGTDCHFYLEVRHEDIEPERLKAAWLKLFEVHEMMSARYTSAGTIESAPVAAAERTFHYEDISGNSDINNYLSDVRKKLSGRCTDAENGEVCGLFLSCPCL